MRICCHSVRGPQSPGATQGQSSEDALPANTLGTHKNEVKAAGQRRSMSARSCDNLACLGQLLQAEALGVHDGKLEAVGHEVLGAVGGQQQRVEAGVRRRQLLRVWAIPLQHAPAHK